MTRLLKVADTTVKLHRASVMHKMNAESLADVVRKADALGAGCTSICTTRPLRTLASSRPIISRTLQRLSVPLFRNTSRIERHEGAVRVRRSAVC